MNRSNSPIEQLESRTLFALATFTIDPAVSSLRLSGNVADALDMEAQRSGSLNDFYEGTIVADITDNTISFPGSSNVVAKATRSYSPGSGPANYGAKAETGGIFSVKIGEAAVRDFAFDLQSSDLPLADNGAFGASALDLKTTGGELKYDLLVGDDGDIDLDDKTANNNAAGNATLRGEGGNRTLTIPIDIELEDGSTTLRFRGTLVATTGTAAPIDPNVVRIGDGTLVSGVQFVDADGTATTISMTGGGSADVRFTNATQQTSGNKGRVTVSGTGVELIGIDATGTTGRTRLAVTGKGGADRVTVLREITTDGAIGSIGGKGVLLADDIAINGRLGSLAVSRMTNVHLTAESVGTVKVSGDVSVSTVTLNAPFAPGTFALRSFTAAGDFTASRISTLGAIGAFKVKTMLFSEIHSGVTSPAETDFPAAEELSPDGSIGSVTIKTFSDSAIAADTLGKLKLGVINTTNAGTPFGIAADAFVALQATNTAKQQLKLTATDDPALLSDMLAAQSFDAGDFVIRLK